MTEQKTREAFEAFVRRGSAANEDFLGRDENGDYTLLVARGGWAAWQGCLAHTLAMLDAPEVVELVATAMINGLRMHKGCVTPVSGTHAMLDDDAESYRAEARAAIAAMKKHLEVV